MASLTARRQSCTRSHYLRLKPCRVIPRRQSGFLVVVFVFVCVRVMFNQIIQHFALGGPIPLAVGERHMIGIALGKNDGLATDLAGA